jgi:hypothetical protein
MQQFATDMLHFCVSILFTSSVCLLCSFTIVICTHSLVVGFTHVPLCVSIKLRGGRHMLLLSVAMTMSDVTEHRSVLRRSGEKF